MTTLKETTHKVKNETISRYISGILTTATLGLFAIFYQHRWETLTYVCLGIAAVSFIFFARLLIRHWIYDMIEKRATTLFEEKIKPMDDLIRYYQAEQYKINVSDSERINKMGFSIGSNNSELKQSIENGINEQLLPMNVAIALLVSNLSKVVYNSNGANGMKSRSHLDDFNDNYKDVVLRMNITGKDNQYKEQLVSNYFKLLNRYSATNAASL